MTSPPCTPEDDPLDRLVRLLNSLPENISDSSSGSGSPGSIITPGVFPADALFGFSDFRLLGKLGQGGMGKVYEALQLSLDRRVALKVLSPILNEDPKNQARFRREALAASKSSHANIVKVYEVGEEHGHYYIVQELVEGGRTLQHHLEEMRSARQLPGEYYRNTAEFFAKTADALEAAHEQNIIHRDIKPENILLAPDGEPKVADFGLAKMLDEMRITDSGDSVGTQNYKSPEHFDRRFGTPGHRSDIFSLGATLYEALTLVLLFNGERDEIRQQILHREAEDPRKIRQRVPRELATICLKALEKQPSRRYQSMAELAAELRRYIRNEPILARRPSAGYRAIKWTRRNPTKSVAAVLAVAVFATISVLLTQNIRANKSLKIERGHLAQRTSELEAANEAERRRADEVLRLSALQDYDDLIARANALWPALPKHIDAFESWIDDARKLLSDLAIHRAKRQELRADALPQSELERQSERESHSDFPRLQALPAEIEKLGADLIAAANDDEALGISAALEQLEAEQRELEERVSERRDWQFPEAKAQSRWWNNQLTKLIDELESLTDSKTGLLSEAVDAVSEEHGWSLPRRLSLARSLEQGFAPGGEFDVRWRLALPSVQAAYPGLTLSPQMGIVPIGPDPESGLWEFWHVPSGKEPNRRADGKLALTEDMGLVFVLIPAGSFWMGAQSESIGERNYDRQAQVNEAPPHEVKLSAFFLSKFEMTQAQWQHLSGLNPSFHGPHNWESDWLRGNREVSALHPVEQVSWIDCTRLLTRLGLALPSEAQWEYAARAGTDTVWWTGSDYETLRQKNAANLLDAYAKKHGGDSWIGHELWLDDGATVHAAIGSYAANAFGIHDVCGSVWEWCWDGYNPTFYGPSDAQNPLSLDPIAPWDGFSNRVNRGGSMLESAAFARSAQRGYSAAGDAAVNIGVRPIITIK